jgi:hypothetical protein
MCAIVSFPVLGQNLGSCTATNQRHNAQLIQNKRCPVRVIFDRDEAVSTSRHVGYQYRTSSLLFLGCSLNQDRTVRVFQAIKDAAGALDIPQHFAIEQCPEDERAMQARNEYLLRLGITPIWFEAGRFECVEGLLRLIRNEIRYRRKA